MLVFDSSAFINGGHDHYPLPTFPSVWELVGTGMGDGRIISPREVYNELAHQADDVFEWAKQRRAAFVDPSEDVQHAAGAVQAALPQSHTRDAADPWVIAEAQVRGFTVVTYEGRSFTGVPHARWARSMPGICQRFQVPCRTLAEALGDLGATF